MNRNTIKITPFAVQAKYIAAVIALLSLTAVILTVLPTQALITCPLPTNTGKASSSITIAAGGNQRVWSRIKVPDTTNNSYYLQVDGNCASALLIGDSPSITPGSWVWVDYRDGSTTTKADINMTAGAHTIDLIGNEGGVQIDRVLLLSDSCVPTGTGANCEATTDTTAPETAITSAIPSTANPSFNFTSNEAGSTFQCQLDTGTYTTCTSPKAYSNLAAGSHTFNVKATDATGNTDATPASQTWIVGSSTADCTQTLSAGANVATAITSAAADSTICLNAGDYGNVTLSGVSKTSRVTVKPANGVARASVVMSVSLTSVNNLTIDGVTFKRGVTDSSYGGGTHTVSARIHGTSQNITLSNSDFLGFTMVGASQMSNANIVFDTNQYKNIDPPGDPWNFGPKGRIHIHETSGQPNGIVIKNSLFEGGSSDGIRIDDDARGTQILDNVFTNIKDPGLDDSDPKAEHTDPIQSYPRSIGTVIRGNLFLGGGAGTTGNVSATIMMPDGNSGQVIENNVFTPGNYGFAILLYSDTASTIRHNTLVDGTCKYGRCGVVLLGNKGGEPVGQGTIIRDNILSSIDNDGNGEGGGIASFSSSYNLYHGSKPSVSTTNDLLGTASFVGPLGTYNGYRLASGSPGISNASDSKDRGVDYSVTLPPSTKVGDLDGDTYVTGHDLSLLLGRFNTTYAPYDLDAAAPINGHDLSLLLSKFGT